MLVFLALVALTVGADESTVQISSGLVQGVVSDSSRQFLGVPFGKPPVGALRWTYPVAPDPWNYTFQATKFGAGCAQDCNLPPLTCPDFVSEDCLNLNVFTPRLAKITQPLPVMFFIPGGRFEQGAAGTWLYWGDYLVNSSSVILVTTNYRLGAFGWLASESISGNYGLEDQRLALKWTIQNIAQFGGDPNRVMLFGQSAGGTSTAVHLTSKASFGLYQSAVIHSNPFALPMSTPSSAALVAKDFALALGCAPNDLTCMRSKTMDQCIKASNVANDHINISDPVSMFYPWTPVIDGVRVDGQPIELFNAGKFYQVPTMIGNVEEEALLFIWEIQEDKPADFNEYVAILEGVFGTQNAPKVLNLYPNSGYNTTDYRYVMSEMGTDYIFNCPNRAVSRAISNTNKSLPLYFYRFNHAISFDCWGPNYTFCVDHVCHASELVFIFESETQDDSGFLFTTQEQYLADSMARAWTNFAWTSNPNQAPKLEKYWGKLSAGEELGDFVDVTWPQWTPSNDFRITYETPQNTIVYNHRQPYCDFWDQFNYLNPKIPITRM